MRFLVVALVLIAGFLSCGMNTNYVVEKEYHVVRTGETLWEIAGDRMDKQDRHKDIREFIYEIRKANGLDGRLNLQVGDCLEIPLYKETKK